MNSLFKSYNTNVLSAYIIYLPGNSASVSLANRCLNSCRMVGQAAELYEGFDGTGSEIIVPEPLKYQQWLKWIKISDHFQSLTEVACSLSHISLWALCVEKDQPIIVFEHDAISVKPYYDHVIYNSITYLGCSEQKGKQNIPLQPPHSTINHNWNFINRAHAYCIDPPSAKKLLINVIERGIFESADVMMRCDDVTIIQHGFYAYDSDEGVTTQPKRKGNLDHRFNR